MKIRAKSVIKLTNGRVNMDFTFAKEGTLESAVKSLLIHIGYNDGIDTIQSVADQAIAAIKKANQ